MNRFSPLLAWLGLAAAGMIAAVAQEEVPTEAGAKAPEKIEVSPQELPKSPFTVDPTPPERPDGTAAMLAKVRPAIVSVFPARLLAQGEVEVLKRFFGSSPGEGDGGDGEANPEDNIQGVGSGVLLTADGLVVTNSHVVHLSTGKLADAIYVELIDKRRFPAEVVGVDPLTDLALLRIKGDDFPFFTIADSEHVQVGDKVFAVGSPFKIGDTTTAGIVSALRRNGLNLNGPNGYESFIQTDAPINPGNSGGGLVDRHGRLIGINTAIYGGAGGNVGIGFAIPSNLAQHVLARLLEDGELKRGFLGIKVESVDAAITAAGMLSEIRGVRVVDLLKGGPADEGGIEKGDILLSVNDQPVDNRGAFRLAISLFKPDEELQVKGFRGTHSITASVRLAESSNAGAKGADFEITALPGVRLRFAGEEKPGLEVVRVHPGSAYAGKLKEGMFIIEINGTPVQTFANASAALTSGVNKVVVRHAERTVTLALRIN
jgi:S1-C subfamily serine protease